MKKNYHFCLVIWLMIFICLESKAQTYNMSNTPITTCSGTFYDNGGSGGNYSDNTGFTQTFTSADGNRIRLNFTSFDTWSNDLLRFYDGPNTTYPWLGNYSGTLSPFTIESTGNVITVVFIPSNTNTSKAGWAATISCTTPPLTNYDMNSGTVTSCEGVFYDSGGPTGNYASGEDKTVTFCSGTTDFLRFTFTRRDAATVFGSGDSLFIYDGPDVASPPIAVYVQGSRFEEFTSTSTCVTFRFKSDGTSQAVGWQALFSCTNTPGAAKAYLMAKGVHYTCSGTFVDDGGGGDYSDNSNNTQVFRSANGNRIKFDFTSFDTWGNDLLRIYDGPNTSYPWLGNYSGTLSPFTIESTSDVLTFVFIPSNTNTSKPGWSANISCTTPVLTRYDMNSGTVTACEGAFYDSGGPTANYSGGEDKTVTFCSGTSDFLQFTFSRTEAATQLGAGDSLFVYEGSNTSSSPIAVYVQGSRFETFTSTGNCVTFRFKSDGSGESTGWQAIFKCTSTAGAATTYRMGKGIYYTCSGTFVDDGGSGGNYDDYTDYNSQTFVSYSGCGIRFTFSQFDTWAGDELIAYDGPNTSSPLIGNYSGTISNLIIQSSGNAVTFVWNSNSNGATKPGFNATITCPNVTAPPTPGANTPVCAGDDLNLTASNVPGASYSWTGPDGFASTDQNPTINSVTTAKAGTYTVTAIVGTCASTAESISVAVETAPAAPAVNSNSPVCTGNAINLTCATVSGATYSWSGPDGFASTDQNPSIASATTDAAGTYTVTVTKGSCTVVNSTSVTVNISPGNVSASSNSPVCAGTTLNLTSSSAGATSYSWSGPNSFSSTDQNPSLASATTAASGTYTVTASLGSCSKQNTVNITVSNAPTATAGSNSPLCEGSTLNLSANTVAGATYSWSGPNSFSSSDEDPSITSVSTAGAGTYTVNISIGSCSDQDDVVVTVNPAPTTPTAGSNSPVCAGDDINLTASTVGGATYYWTGPNGFTSSMQNPTRSAVVLADEGIYSVRAIAGGCQSAAGTVNVSVTSISSVTASNNGPQCEGDAITLNVTTVSGAAYSWSGPNSFSSTDQSPVISNATVADAGSYTVSVTAGSCSAQNTTNVTVNAAPAIPTISFDGVFTLTSSAASGNQWYLNGTSLFGQDQQTCSLFGNGVYTVEVTDGNGCTSVSAPYNHGVTSTANANGIGSIFVYPNPSEGLFRISGENLNTDKLNLKILNAYGMEVKAESFQISGSSVNEQLNLRSLEKGVYFLHMDGVSISHILKIVIQ